MRLDGKQSGGPSCLVVDLSQVESQIAGLEKKITTLQGQLVDLASVMSTLLAQNKKPAPPKASPPPPKPAPEAVPKPVAKKKAGSKRKR